ncbi:proenkephalin-A-like [Carassius gibelio]|uniref:proenkephalin-A-like n=1 Tax=Carassius gibelio TaxID=101364 RepID=UPI0022785B18|nr:proenkephalin-A-like [Carassius gibelio]
MLLKVVTVVSEQSRCGVYRRVVRYKILNQRLPTRLTLIKKFFIFAPCEKLSNIFSNTVDAAKESYCKQPMALTVNWWSLVLSACLVLMVRAECGRDCALCVFRLLRQQTEIDKLTCSLQCEGTVDSRQVEICKNIISQKDRLAMDNLKQDEESADHLLAKKYGGFMKRYGGFMIKKAAEIGTRAPAESDITEAMSKKYGGFMKKDKPEGGAEDQLVEQLREILRDGPTSKSDEQHDGDMVKRYRGFLRSVQENSGLGEAGRDLHKRYGGFMRRVGRPDWLENQKSNGFLKRTWEDGGETALPNMQKRYGRFMD